ncbi:MAG: hypothetical protein HC902_02145 [Calothrix sp. SM1_5_4]|nr:hypothetical protein [Calothrix sp. SM1_5_4]
MTASWTVWNPRSSRASAETIEFSKNPISKDEYQVFQNLERILMQISSSRTPASHQLLVVPEEIKPLVTKLIMTRWATDAKDMEGPWSHKNRDLALFRVAGSDITQNTIIDNFESMKGSLVNRRPVLLADMADLLKIGRPNGREKPFKIKDPVLSSKRAAGFLGEVEGKPPVAKNEDDSDNEDSNLDGENADEDEEDIDQAQLPHIIWWISAEGKVVQPKKTKGWSMRQEVSPRIPTLIVTTQKELDAMEQEAAFEHRFMNFQDTFQTTYLDRPSDDDKRLLFEDLFRRPEIASLHYSFEHDGLSSDDARRQLIGLTIGRVEQISKQLKVESTYAFLKIYIALKKALTDDVELRRSRQINSSYLFRLFARVFPLPLSYEILRADDPMQKFRDHERAARGLQEAGYEAPWTPNRRSRLDQPYARRSGSRTQDPQLDRPYRRRRNRKNVPA